MDEAANHSLVTKPANTSVKFRAQKIPTISRIVKGIRNSCPTVVDVQSESVVEPVEDDDKPTTTNGGVINESSVAQIDDSDDEIDGDHQEEPDKHGLSMANASHDVNLDALRKNLSTYPVVESLPNKNDFIGFRVLKMAANYVPELSDYVIGLVESVDGDTMDMEIVILAGNEELKDHQEGGKFSLPDCDDTLVNIDDRTLHCNWVELKDVRLVDVTMLA